MLQNHFENMLVVELIAEGNQNMVKHPELLSKQKFKPLASLSNQGFFLFDDF